MYDGDVNGELVRGGALEGTTNCVWILAPVEVAASFIGEVTVSGVKGKGG